MGGVDSGRAWRRGGRRRRGEQRERELDRRARATATTAQGPTPLPQFGGPHSLAPGITLPVQ